MKKILLASALLLATIANAQNWELFKANETYNFNFDNIHGVRVDSVKTQGNETTFHFNRILNDTVHQNIFSASYPITDITQPNIFGNHCVERNDSLIFTNQFNNLLFIRPKANLIESWRFLSGTNYHIVATVDSVYSDSITNTQDSLKQITFQYFDSSNTAINHPINSKVFIISKSNGIVSTFNFYEDAIGNSLSFNYKKQYRQIFKSTTFTNAQVFDLNVGDEYHFMLNDSPPNTPPGHDIYNHTVTTKTTSANGDTIRLRILEHREKQTSTVDFTTNPPTLVFTTTNSSRSLTRTILHPNATFNSDVGFEVTVSHDTTSGIYDSIATITKYSKYLPYYNTSTYNDRITINKENQIFSFDSLQNSWILDYNMQNLYSNYYLTGVFYFTNYWNNQSGGGGYPEYFSMLYFKKGNETWGTPRLVTGIEDPIKTEEEIYLYPNPSNDIIQFETFGTSFKEIHVFDMQGRVIQALPFQNNLNVSEFENGLYLLKLIGQKKVVDLKFVKR